MKLTYICPSCGATKTLIKAHDQSISPFEQSFPKMIFCWFQGCRDYALPEYGR